MRKNDKVPCECGRREKSVKAASCLLCTRERQHRESNRSIEEGRARAEHQRIYGARDNAWVLMSKSRS